MIGLSSSCTRKIFIAGAFLFLVSMSASIHSMAAEILLTPPGLILIKDPPIVVPADFRYANGMIKLPAYQDCSGNPSNGWSAKFVETRRFASDQSAWIFFRNSDFQKTISRPKEGNQGAFRFWPVGTTIIIEIYKGIASQKENDKLIEIAAMSKIRTDKNSFLKAFYPVNWTYDRFKPNGSSSITSDKVRECHQCHSIAFHLTGDLIFTQFP
jgi:hypothetical protein